MNSASPIAAAVTLAVGSQELGSIRRVLGLASGGSLAGSLVNDGV